MAAVNLLSEIILGILFGLFAAWVALFLLEGARTIWEIIKNIITDIWEIITG